MSRGLDGGDAEHVHADDPASDRQLGDGTPPEEFDRSSRNPDRQRDHDDRVSPGGGGNDAHTLDATSGHDLRSWTVARTVLPGAIGVCQRETLDRNRRLAHVAGQPLWLRALSWELSEKTRQKPHQRRHGFLQKGLLCSILKSKESQLTHIGEGLLAGLAATVVLFVLMVMKGMIVSSDSSLLGWAAHFVIGVAGYGIATSPSVRMLHREPRHACRMIRRRKQR